MLFAAQPLPLKPLPPRPPVQPQARPHSQPLLTLESDDPTDPMVGLATGKGKGTGKGSTRGQGKDRTAAQREEPEQLGAVSPMEEAVEQGPPAIHFGMLTATRDALRSSFMGTSVAASAASDAIWETQSAAGGRGHGGGGGNDDSSLWRNNSNNRAPVRVALSTSVREKDESSVSASVVMSSHATAMSSELQ